MLYKDIAYVPSESNSKLNFHIAAENYISKILENSNRFAENLRICLYDGSWELGWILEIREDANEDLYLFSSVLFLSILHVLPEKTAILFALL